MTDPPEPAPTDQPAPAPSSLVRLRQFSRLLDEAVEIPVLGVRVGLDSLIGLLPGVGDVVGAATAGWIIVTAARLGASRAVLLRMLANAGVDALIGMAPLAGDVFDVFFKANRRNLQLLEDHLSDPVGTHRKSRRQVALAVGGVAALLLGLVLAAGGALVVLVRAVSVMLG